MFELFLDSLDSCLSALAADGDLAPDFHDGGQPFNPIGSDLHDPSVQDGGQAFLDHTGRHEDPHHGLAAAPDPEASETHALPGVIPDCSHDPAFRGPAADSPWASDLDHEFPDAGAVPYDPSEGLLSSTDFECDGQYDPIHQCKVVGDVTSDIDYVHQQTRGSCSLMAQGQFVERHTGVNVSEQVLEDLAASWGVYTPEGGTTFAGQDAILDYFNVPHQRFTEADAEMLDKITADGHDGLISVDARHFYNDPTIPGGSGHAVAVVGKGIDLDGGETKGYYFTDSNFPDTSRFLTVEELHGCWYGDLIAIPGQGIA